MKVQAEFDIDKPEHRALLQTILKAMEVPSAPQTEQELRTTPPLKTVQTRKFWPKVYGRSEETIKQMLDFMEIASAQELRDHTDIAPQTVSNYLSRMVSKGVVDKSTESPPRYFLRFKGNPNIREMLPSGTKVSFMK